MASVWRDGDESPIDLSPRADVSSDEEETECHVNHTPVKDTEADNEPPKKAIPAVSPYSRLLAPTRSWMGKETPLYGSGGNRTSKTTPRTKSPVKRASSTGSTNTEDSPETRYLQLTESRKAALAREKKEEVEVDPREEAWNATPLKPWEAPVGTIADENKDEEEEAPYQPTLYAPPTKFKGVKSKLHVPTTASVRKMREYYSSGDREGSPELHKAPFNPSKRASSPSNRRHSSPIKKTQSADYAHVTSRLFDYTASRKAFMKSAEESPPEPPPARKRAPTTPPAVASKVTKAMERGKREKYVASNESFQQKRASFANAPPPPACSEKITKAMERGRREKFDSTDHNDVAIQLKHNRSASAPPVRPRTLSTSTTSSTSGGTEPLSPPPTVMSPRSLRRQLRAEGSPNKPPSVGVNSSPTDKKRVDNTTNEWREKEALPYANSCLEIMRGFVPPDAQFMTAAEFQEMGLQPVLALRMATKPCLWLVREKADFIMSLTSHDMTTRFDYSKQGLDIVELAAIYACLPTRFDDEEEAEDDGRREKWRSTLEYQLKRLMKQKEYKSFPGELRRNPAYEGQDALFAQIEGPETAASINKTNTVLSPRSNGGASSESVAFALASSQLEGEPDDAPVTSLKDSLAVSRVQEPGEQVQEQEQEQDCGDGGGDGGDGEDGESIYFNDDEVDALAAKLAARLKIMTKSD
jgi:hypothetical protein